jgi:DNA-binding transcriptional ArsR family regulator
LSDYPLPEGWDDAAALCGLLSQPPRLQMIMFLAGGEQEVGAVGRAVGMAQPLATYHLRVLRTGGIVATRRAGRRVLYRLRERAAVASAAGFALRGAHGRAQLTVGPV